MYKEEEKDVQMQPLHLKQVNNKTNKKKKKKKKSEKQKRF